MLADLDVVKLTKDVPEHSLNTGQVGTVLEVFYRPNLAYLVEFCNGDGETIALLPLTPDFLQLQQSFHKQPLAA